MMLDRLQSALKTIKDSRPSSLMAHRFVTVRRGSPAARSGQIQPGDRLEAVEGRPVGGLQHRDLSQILRRAGNTLRLSITPKQQSSSDGADLDTNGRLIKGPRGRSKDESRFYSVDLERGPTGFGFSLRGGSEYNMGLYVLGLMDGGPAQRSNRMQVSDQLVEINGDSTAGMTHSQAVEQIRRGGHRIHLVLKKGNGYVPDYGLEEGAISPSLSSRDQEFVAMTTASLSREWREREGERRRERKVETKRRTGGAGPPDLDLDRVEEEAQEEQKRMQRKREEEEEEAEMRRQEEEEEEERKRRRRRKEEKRERSQTKFDNQGRRTRSLPRNGASSWGSSLPEEAGGAGQSDRRRSHTVSRHAKDHGSSATAPREAFSFLMPMNDNPPSDSESAASSEIRQSSAVVRGGAQENGPGLWLKPNPQKLSQVLTGSRFRGRELADGLSL